MKKLLLILLIASYGISFGAENKRPNTGDTNETPLKRQRINAEEAKDQKMGAEGPMHVNPIVQLIIAINQRNPKLVKQLISERVNVNIKNTKTGYTPLMVAVKTANLEIVKLLLDAGADINAQAKDPMITPLYLATLTRNDNLIRFLIGYGAKIDPADISGPLSKDSLDLMNKWKPINNAYYIDDKHENFKQYDEAVHKNKKFIEIIEKNLPPYLKDTASIISEYTRIKLKRPTFRQWIKIMFPANLLKKYDADFGTNIPQAASSSSSSSSSSSGSSSTGK